MFIESAPPKNIFNPEERDIRITTEYCAPKERRHYFCPFEL